MQVVVVDRSAVAPQVPPPSVELRIDYWDDYTFNTMYDATFRTGAEELFLGKVKVLQRGQPSGRTPLPGTFWQLDATYASLGQDIEYYEKLMTVPPDLRRQYLRVLRDAAFDPSIATSFVDEPGWKTSLLRFGQAVNALEAGRRLLEGQTSQSGQLNFHMDWRHDGGTTPVDFEFDDTGDLPGRCHVLIGYNGVGKTTLLADLALAASSGSNVSPTSATSTISGEDNTFGAVVAVSYSAFDTFRTPESVAGIPEPSVIPDSAAAGRTEVFGYVYCGLRRLTDRTPVDNQPTYKLKSIDEIETEFAHALGTVGRRSESREHLISAFRALGREPSFGRAGVDLGALGSGMDSQGAINAFRTLSTGHKIVLNIVTQLAAHLRTRSLVLIDEPESHLHPPLMAGLLRAVQILLTGHDSFAVIATHSPVVVQEIPSRYVKILERYVSVTSLRDPEIETFGENIGTITRHVFSLDSSATDYQGVLASLAERYTVDQIAEMFAHGLSAQARALVLTYQSRR